jgi:hypothetical protein
MREVLASTALRSTQKCEPKPTEVGEARRRVNRNETIAYQGVLNTEGYPRCGDRCGDTLHRGVSVTKPGVVLEKRFESL